MSNTVGLPSLDAREEYELSVKVEASNESARATANANDVHSTFTTTEAILNYLKSKDGVIQEERLYKTPKEAFSAVTALATKKAHTPIDKLILLGILAGVWISFGGCFAITVAYGCPGIAENNPGLQKLLVGVTFPVALFAIVFLAGELFTGNVMYSFAGAFAGTIPIKKCFVICFTAYFSNMIGCIGGAYFFGYLTEVYAADPWLTAVKHIAEVKTNYGFGVCFLRAVAANWLVNIALYVVFSADDVAGKFFGLFYPIAAFAAAGFEHCIANMFFVPLGMMYGADVSVSKFIVKSLIPATLGNIVGGGICVGVTAWYVFGWQDEPSVKDHPPKSRAYKKWLHFSFL